MFSALVTLQLLRFTAGGISKSSYSSFCNDPATYQGDALAIDTVYGSWTCDYLLAILLSSYEGSDLAYVCDAESSDWSVYLPACCTDGELAFSCDYPTAGPTNAPTNEPTNISFSSYCNDPAAYQGDAIATYTTCDNYLEVLLYLYEGSDLAYICSGSVDFSRHLSACCTDGDAFSCVADANFTYSTDSTDSSDSSSITNGSPECGPTNPQGTNDACCSHKMIFDDETCAGDPSSQFYESIPADILNTCYGNQQRWG